MPSYDLRSSPWIPVVFLNGRSGAVGLRDVLCRAHEIEEIYTDSPVEVAALNRLLTAITLRIFEETEDEDEWFERWHTGRFETDRIDAYLEAWAGRFDLLHPEYPFYQDRTEPGQSVMPVGALRLEDSAYTSNLFSHADQKVGDTLSLEAAARGIVATQFAAIGGTTSQPYRYALNTPFIKSALFWLYGENLFQTLLLNSPPGKQARMGGRRAEDRPSWECDEPISSKKRPHKGLLDYLTLQARRLLLVTEEIEENLRVTGLRITGGDTIEPAATDDPHFCWKADSKISGLKAYGLRENRALWRDATLFFTLLLEEGKPPMTFRWASQNEDELGVEGLSFNVFGLVTDRAKISLWRREHMPFFGAFLRDDQRATALRQALDRAEKQSSTLNVSGRVVAENLPLTPDERAPFISALGIQSRYWARLEVPFYSLLEKLARAGEPDESLRGWTEQLHRTALASYDAATSSFDASARHLKAVALGRAAIRPVAPYRQPALPASDIQQS